MANTAYSQEYPLGTPSVSGANLTVDVMLAQPTRINAYLSDLALKKYFAERIFTNGGGVTGGALVYTQLTTNDLFPTRATQSVVPGAEFPEVTFDRPTPLTAQVEKLGGKFRVTDEARDRNDLTPIQTESIKLANDIVRQMHSRALVELDAAITGVSGSATTVSGNGWATAKGLTISTQNQGAMPAADFGKAQLKSDTFEFGADYSLWVVNPTQMSDFRIVYGNNYQAVLDANNVEMISSNQVTAGTAYVVAPGAVGQVRYEQPLQTVSYRDEGTESTWVKTSIRSVFAVTNPYSVLKFTGLGS